MKCLAFGHTCEKCKKDHFGSVCKFRNSVQNLTSSETKVDSYLRAITDGNAADVNVLSRTELSVAGHKFTSLFLSPTDTYTVVKLFT